MSRTRRSLAALALIALISVISAGCSNAPVGTGGSGGNNAATNYEQAVQFAQCMRNNGVSEFPDPNASGRFAYGTEGGSSLGTVTLSFH